MEQTYVTDEIEVQIAGDRHPYKATITRLDGGRRSMRAVAIMMGGCEIAGAGSIRSLLFARAGNSDEVSVGDTFQINVNGP